MTLLSVRRRRERGRSRRSPRIRPGRRSGSDRTDSWGRANQRDMPTLRNEATRPRTLRPVADLAHLSDEALVALVARGDDGALGELYDRYGRVAYGVALRVLRDAALAEDAVQEAFLTLWRTAARFVPERARASTWLLTLVHRRAVDAVRREQRRRTEPLERRPGPGLGRRRRRRAPAAGARARPGRARAAPGRAARGARARLLRRLHAGGARGPARTAAGYDQEQDVQRAAAARGAPR